MKEPAADGLGASRKYEELEIEVARCLCGKDEVRILNSPFDRPREHFKLPFSLITMNQKLETLNKLMLKEDDVSKIDRKSLAEEIGQKLYEALLPGAIRQTFGNCLAALRMVRDYRDASLRIRLSFGESSRYLPEVVGLPWELICSPATMEFPASHPESPLVRYLDLDRPIEPVTVEPPIQVLAVIPSPRGLPSIDRQAHKTILQNACGSHLQVVEPPTLASLCSELRSRQEQGQPIHVLQYFGHGLFGADGEGALAFERPDGGREDVSGRVLARSLAGFKDLRLTLLATCKGAQMMRRRGQHPFTGTASALVAGGIPAVVGMQFTVSVSAATEFCSSFYRSVFNGRSLEEAVTEGRSGILATDPSTFEWASPVLFLRSRDGQILDARRTKAQPKIDRPSKSSLSVGDSAGGDFYKAYVINMVRGGSPRIRTQVSPRTSPKTGEQ